MTIARRPGVIVVTGERSGGPVTVALSLQEDGVMYTVSATGAGINETTPEVKRFLDSVRIDE